MAVSMLPLKLSPSCDLKAKCFTIQVAEITLAWPREGAREAEQVKQVEQSSGFLHPA